MWRGGGGGGRRDPRPRDARSAEAWKLANLQRGLDRRGQQSHSSPEWQLNFYICRTRSERRGKKRNAERQVEFARGERRRRGASFVWRVCIYCQAHSSFVMTLHIPAYRSTFYLLCARILHRILLQNFNNVIFTVVRCAENQNSKSLEFLRSNASSYLASYCAAVSKIGTIRNFSNTFEYNSRIEKNL